MALIALAAACHGTPLSPGEELRGSWGGDGFGLQVSASSASAVFDCAYGTLATPIPLGPRGEFSIEGQYVREVGPAALPNPATYAGRVTRSSIELTVTVTDTIGSAGQYRLGPFTGVEGDDPTVVYCQ
jgi:hypothetical protein